jgi:hypothetical protein
LAAVSSGAWWTAVEVSWYPPGRFQLGVAGQDPTQGLDSFDVEPVETGQLQVSGAEDLGVEGGAAALVADVLDASPHLD